jgi:hypothetical protein
MVSPPPPTLPPLTIHPKIKAAAVVAAVLLAANGLLLAFGPALPLWVLAIEPILPVIAGYLKSGVGP